MQMISPHLAGSLGRSGIDAVRHARLTTLAKLVAVLGCVAAHRSHAEQPPPHPATAFVNAGGKSVLTQQLEEIFSQPTFAVIPNRTFAAADFGAKADGTTVNTQAIQKAIDAAAKAGGGVVTLPKGTIVSGALFIKSNVELRLDAGVILQAVADDSQYPDNWTRIAGIEMTWPAALINVYGVQNARVTGKGIIDGNGKYWWDKFSSVAKDHGKELRWAVDYDAKRVRPVVVYKSQNVLLKDFTIQRAGFWSVTLTFSDQIHVDGVTIRNNIGGHGPSTDGIDIDSSSHLLVENCDVDCNDDNFCLKAGRDSDGLRVNRPTEDVVIRNSRTGGGSGMLTIGSETSGGFNNIEVYGLKASGTAIGIRMKSAKVRGGVIKDIYIHDIKMDKVRTAIYFELNWYPSYSYPPPPKNVPEAQWPAHWKIMLTEVLPPERGIPEVRNIKIANITVTRSGRAFAVNAFPEKPIKGVDLSNVSIEAKSGGSIKNAADWTMTNVTLRGGTQVELKNTTNVPLPVFQVVGAPEDQNHSKTRDLEVDDH